MRSYEKILRKTWFSYYSAENEANQRCSANSYFVVDILRVDNLFGATNVHLIVFVLRNPTKAI